MGPCMSILLFAQMTAFGPAILVVCCLALMAIIGFFFTTYYCHCFLLVVIESAAGVNEVRWPSESIVEWITKPIYVFWVLLPLLVPPFVMFVATGNGIAFGVTVLLMLWLVAPLFFLSSLAAKSWLALLHGPLLARWALSPRVRDLPRLVRCDHRDRHRPLGVVAGVAERRRAGCDRSASFVSALLPHPGSLRLVHQHAPHGQSEEEAAEAGQGAQRGKPRSLGCRPTRTAPRRSYPSSRSRRTTMP